MFVYNKGRLYRGKISFVLPDNVMIMQQNLDPLTEGFYIVALDKSFSVQFYFLYSRKQPKTIIKSYLNENKEQNLIGEIEDHDTGKVKGCRAFYENDETLYERYVFNVPENKACGTIDVTVSIRKDFKKFNEAEKNRIVSEVLNGFSVE